MGNLVFWIVFLGFLCLVVILGIYRQKKEKTQRVEEIISGYNSKSGEVFYRSDTAVLKNGFNLDNRSLGFVIDDITWNDLSLDIIFNDMNRTVSSAGEDYLYSRLHILYEDEKSITDFSSFSRDIYKDEQLLKKIVTVLNDLGKLKGNSVKNLFDGLFKEKPSSIKKDLLLIVLFIISIALIFVSPGLGFILFLGALVVNISSYFQGKNKMEKNIKAFFYVYGLIRCMNDLKPFLKDKYFENENELGSLLKGSFIIAKGSGTSSNVFSIVADYIRMIFHVDLIVYNTKLSTIIEKKELIESLYEKIGMVDAAIAVASYRSLFDITCEPSFSEDKNVYNGVDLYHPLTKTPVHNSICLDGGALITGSNASGKSTFLKTVGISICFAQSLGFALASRLQMSFFKLYTSMALNDNIIGSESYYVVESKSIKRICDGVDLGENVLCIIDEVLKGTNTKERIAASSNILRYLREKGAFVLAATHDIELTEILKKIYSLYYFTEVYENGNVCFPYKINEGVSDKGNAIRLLEVLGFDESITNGASRMSDSYSCTGKWELC